MTNATEEDLRAEFVDRHYREQTKAHLRLLQAHQTKKDVESSARAANIEYQNAIVGALAAGLTVSEVLGIVPISRERISQIRRAVREREEEAT
jgi:hypothetical protein